VGKESTKQRQCKAGIVKHIMFRKQNLFHIDVRVSRLMVMMISVFWDITLGRFGRSSFVSCLIDAGILLSLLFSLNNVSNMLVRNDARLSMHYKASCSTRHKSAVLLDVSVQMFRKHVACSSQPMCHSCCVSGIDASSDLAPLPPHSVMKVEIITAFYVMDHRVAQHLHARWQCLTLAASASPSSRL
jgi:hypothetical protein